MTLAVVEKPNKVLPNGRLYHSPLGLFPFQEEGVAKSYLLLQNHGVIAVWDTGTGKTHLSMALSALLYEMGEIDYVLVSCERNKLKDWVDDFSKYTNLSVRLYHGPKRKTLLTAMPQILVSTYETVKADCKAEVKGKRTGLGGPLTEALRDKRVLLVYDEITKLRTRSSANYHAHEFLINAIRKNGTAKVVGLTGTPVEKDIEDYFNILRLVAPETVGTVGWFETEYIKSRDMFNRPSFYRERLPEFASRVSPAIIRKRKTDPDVIAQFPRQVEEVTHVTLSETQQKFYKTIKNIYEPPEGEEDRRSPEEVAIDDRRLFSVLRLIAAYPEALSRAQGLLARQITQHMGIEALRATGSSKTDEFLARMKSLANQNDQIVAFTFFGQAVLPLLARDLRKTGISVVEHHGGQSVGEQSEAQRIFKAGQSQIFLSSDAGARGLNFGNASYVDNYEAPALHSIYIQRINRIHRIDSVHPSVTCHTYIADNTIEVGLANSASTRNEYQDIMIDSDTESDENFISAALRREILGLGKK
jgi:SNF2 family DNA or RNA helicase